MTTMWVKRRSGPVFCAVLWVICQCMPGAATEAHASPLDSLGILPDKAVASLQVTNLVTEICQDRAFSIDFPAELPSGYRFIQRQVPIYIDNKSEPSIALGRGGSSISGSA